MASSKPKLLKQLLAAGADLRTYNVLIEVAVYQNCIESIPILLEAGAPIDEKHHDRYTGLTTAIRDNHPEILSLLLSRGANPNFVGENHPLFMPASKPKLLKQLLAAG